MNERLAQTKRIYSKNKDKIAEVFAYVLNNKYSDFYQNKYIGLDINAERINSYDDFKRVPLLTKDELLRVDWERRTFVPKPKLAALLQTSGTTNINKQLVIPVSSEQLSDKDVELNEHPLANNRLKKLKVNKVLLLLPDIATEFYMKRFSQICYAKLIQSDFKDMKVVIQQIKSQKIVGIVSVPTFLLKLTEETDGTNFNCSSIKWIFLQGELISKTRLEYFKNKFPNATIELGFGSIEMTNIGGYQCDKREFEVNTYHPSSNFFFEILDDDGLDVKNGTFGNFVFTSLNTNRALPLIRYYTNDVTSIDTIRCSCGNDRLLTLGGRKDFDILRIFGVTFSTVALEQTLGSLLLKVKNYEFHVEEIRVGNLLKPRITLFINTDEDFDKLSREINSRLLTGFYLSKDKTLSYFLANKIFDSFNITSYKSQAISKQKKIILDT